MSRQTRIFLAIAGIFALIAMVFCCVGGVGGFIFVIERNRVTDPQQAASLASRIADFDLPAGYKIKSASPLFTTLTIMIGDDSKTHVIWIVQGKTKGLSPDAYLRNSISIITYRDVRWDAVDTRTVTILGEATLLTIYTGTKPDNTKYHAWACGFTGRGGPATMVIIGPEATWDEAAMQTFVASIR